MKPIIFNTEMVRSILDGRKTQTRRICSCGQVGDTLWVREKFSYQGDVDWRDLTASIDDVWYYESTDKFAQDSIKWSPSIHLPRRFARLFLEIIDIRVERVQDISERDAIAEGVQYYGSECGDYRNYSYPNKNCDDWGVTTAKESFQTLWNSINDNPPKRDYGWDKNPWVWVIEFRQIS